MDHGKSRADLYASGQVRALVERILSTKSRVRGGVSGQTIEAAKRSTFYEISEWDLDELLDLAALTPAPQPAGEAVPEAWQCKDFAEGWVTYSKQYESHVRKYHEQTGCIIRPLYAHPPQPSVSVAEAGMAALKELANTQMNISLTDWQRISSTIAAALRALKGSDNG